MAALKKKKLYIRKGLYFLIFFLVLPTPSFAYLDPGSGSALMTFIISLFTGLLFSVRKFFYRYIRGIKPSNHNANIGQIIIFSESAIYWKSYTKIVELLIKKKVSFQYYTFDKNDPGLLIESEFMHARYLLKNFIGFARWDKIEGQVLITTTPHIGSKGYLQKPAGVQKLVHFFHSISDIGLYKKYSLDNYDDVLMAGSFQKHSIREIEKVRNLKRKNLLEVGLPYFDELLNRRKISRKNIKNRQILVASSWGSKGLLRNFDRNFLISLTKMGFKVVVRPHPYSLQIEKKFIELMQKHTADYKLIEWDLSVDPLSSMEKADLLISDTSSIRFDFAFIFFRPVISINIPDTALRSFELYNLSQNWEEKVAKEIGPSFKHTEVYKISECLPILLSENKKEKILSLRDKYLNNTEISANNITNYLEANLSV